MDNRTDDQKAKDIAKTQTYLATLRQPFEPMVDNLLEFVRLGRKIRAGAKGKIENLNVYDSTPVQALGMWADGIYAYDCSSALNWFKLTLPNVLNFPRFSGMKRWNGKRLDDIPEVAKWLDLSTNVLRSDFLRSNFYSVITQFIRDGGSIGTADMYAEPDITTGIVTFNPLHFREFFIAENKNRKIDTLYREFNLTLRQMVQKFTLEQCEKSELGFTRQYEQNPYQERTLLHAVYPRDDYDPDKKDNKNMSYASMWVLKGKDKLLMEAGYPYFPHITWRYRVESDELYGRSWAWDAYAEIATVNVQARDNLEGGHKLINPPMVGPSALRGQVHPNAKGWTWVDRMTEDQVPKPLQTGMKVPFAVEMQDRTQKTIDKYAHSDFFMMLTQAVLNKVELTATQVMHMAGEKAAAIAALTDGFNMGPLSDVIDLMWNISWESGRIPPPPDILLEAANIGIGLEVDFIGPLAQMQKTLFETQGIRSGLQMAAEIAAMFPQALTRINADELMKIGLKTTYFPVDAIRTDEDVAAINDANQKMQEAQMAQQSLTETAKALPGAGKAVEPDSPLSMLMNMGVQQ